MAHSHSHSHALEVPRTTARVLTGVAAALTLVTVVGLIALRPGAGPVLDAGRVGVASDQFDARVVGVDYGPCPGQEEAAEAARGMCLEATLRLLEGPDEGETTNLVLPESPSTPDLRFGDTVVVGYEPEAEAGYEYSFFDMQRKPVLFWLALLFAGAVVLLGRLRGLAALGGLAVTLVILLSFIMPAILGGRSPIMVAIFGAGAIAIGTLYLAHGFNHMTTVALLGTLGSLALTAVLAHIFVGLSQLSGFATEEAIIVQLSVGDLDATGIILAGVVIGALGALDDVTVTQSSAVWELKAANPEMPRRSLYRSGLKIGRDHIAATVNTLLLAYAGASMPLLLFFVISEQPLATVANEEIVATEIIRTLVGSMGLVASVPLTTLLAAGVAGWTKAVPHAE